MIKSDADLNVQRDLVHSIQWILALSLFYFYSLIWLFLTDMAKDKLTLPQEKIGRVVFFTGFAAITHQISNLVSYLGQNAALVLLQ